MHHHHHYHDHSDCNTYDHKRENNKKSLIIALIITSTIMFLELFGGIFANSLALLADFGHMFIDASSLLLALIAMWFASKPPSKTKSYGFHRIEILAALANGVTLILICSYIIYEAIIRFFEPKTVESGLMMTVAVIGLLANGISALVMLKKGDVKENVNLRGAYLHILGDMIGSFAVIIAAVIIMFTGWNLADPIVSILFSLIIMKGAWVLIKKTVHILMEGTPENINQDDVMLALKSIEGVKEVHDLHIWTITSGMTALTCHLEMLSECNCQDILQQSIDKLEKDFGIEHITIQLETLETKHSKMKI